MAPWDADSFKRHWKKGTYAQRKKAAAIASAIIESPDFDGNEGMAIATGIARAKGKPERRRKGK